MKYDRQTRYGLTVVGSSDEGLSGDGSGEVAGRVLADLLRVGREQSTSVSGDHVGADAVEVDSSELVDHERGETVVERVDVVDPEEPSLHRGLGNHVTGVQHHRDDEDRGESSSDIVRLGDSSNQSEEGGHD